MKTIQDIQQIKDLISKNGSRIMRVTFIKKDGSERVMSFNPKFVKGLVESYKSESTKQAVETRKKNNPNLINIMDIALKRKGEPDYKCWRSINLETVKSVKAGGELYQVEA